MNKPLIMAKGIVIVMGLIGVANAADDFSHYSLNSWTGFYAGMDAGFVFNNVQLRSQQLGFTNPSETCNTSSDFSTFFPGIQLGYMYQFPNDLVSGIETNVTFNTKQNDTLGCICPNNPNASDRFSFRNQMQSSIKGRGGRALNWNQSIFLPYLTAGASFANTELTYKNEGGDYYSKKTSQSGWLIGAGIEWSFRQNWSLRAEYSYVDYGNIIKLKIPSVYGLVDPNGNARVGLNTNSILLAINYWI
jgi:outer membrane immunogenic protein